MFKKSGSKQPRTAITDLPAQPTRILDRADLQRASGGLMVGTHDETTGTCHWDYFK